MQLPLHLRHWELPIRSTKKESSLTFLHWLFRLALCWPQFITWPLWSQSKIRFPQLKSVLIFWPKMVWQSKSSPNTKESGWGWLKDLTNWLAVQNKTTIWWAESGGILSLSTTVSIGDTTIPIITLLRCSKTWKITRKQWDSISCPKLIKLSSKSAFSSMTSSTDQTWSLMRKTARFLFNTSWTKFGLSNNTLTWNRKSCTKFSTLFFQPETIITQHKSRRSFVTWIWPFWIPHWKSTKHLPSTSRENTDHCTRKTILRPD